MRAITALLGLGAAVWMASAQADVTVLAVRLGANDVVALAKFYDAAFGLKEIDRVGEPATEIIMRHGATVAAAKAGTSPEFLIQAREPGAGNDPRGGGRAEHLLPLLQLVQSRRFWLSGT
jgi:hypothetical protein